MHESVKALLEETDACYADKRPTTIPSLSN